eukprot:tig00000204_g17752.t1
MMAPPHRGTDGWEGRRASLAQVDDALSRLARLVGREGDASGGAAEAEAEGGFASSFAFDPDFKPRHELVPPDSEDAEAAPHDHAPHPARGLKWNSIASRVNSRAARVDKAVAVAAAAFLTRDEGTAQKQQEDFRRNLAAIRQKMVSANKWDPQVGYKVLVPGRPELERLLANSYRHYRFDVPHNTSRIVIYLGALSGDPDLYASFLWEYPSVEQHHWKSDREGDDAIEVTDEDPHFQTAPLYIGVFGKEMSEFRLSVSAYPSHILRSACVENGRCTPREPAYFRVLLEDPRQSVCFRIWLREGHSSHAKLDDDNKPRIHVSNRHKFPDAVASVWSGAFEEGAEEVTVVANPGEPHFRPGWHYACVEGPAVAHFKILAFQRPYPPDVRADPRALKTLTHNVNRGLYSRVASSSSLIRVAGSTAAAAPAERLPAPARTPLARAASFSRSSSRSSLSPGPAPGPAPLNAGAPVPEPGAGAGAEAPRLPLAASFKFGSRARLEALRHGAEESPSPERRRLGPLRYSRRASAPDPAHFDLDLDGGTGSGSGSPPASSPPESYPASRAESPGRLLPPIAPGRPSSSSPLPGAPGPAPRPGSALLSHRRSMPDLLDPLSADGRPPHPLPHPRSFL